MKIYTKKGDAGKTSLLGKSNVYKSDLLIEAYGTIDELNSLIGILNSEIENKEIKQELGQIQNNLFLIGSYLADINRKFITNKQLKILEIQTKNLEISIDKMEKELVPLKNFILPSGSKSASFTHLTRTITRRAERNIVKVHIKTPIDKNILVYINRLSDYFFVLARYLNKQEKVLDKIWKI